MAEDEGQNDMLTFDAEDEDASLSDALSSEDAPLLGSDSMETLCMAAIQTINTIDTQSLIKRKA